MHVPHLATNLVPLVGAYSPVAGACETLHSHQKARICQGGSQTTFVLVECVPGLEKGLEFGEPLKL